MIGGPGFLRGLPGFEEEILDLGLNAVMNSVEIRKLVESVCEWWACESEVIDDSRNDPLGLFRLFELSRTEEVGTEDYFHIVVHPALEVASNRIRDGALS